MSSNHSRSTIAFLWHGFFLALTMAMLDLNTVFPTLITALTANRLVFGTLYSILLGIPLLFNVVFSHYLRHRPYKKPFLLLGIGIRSLSFLGMAAVTFFFALDHPEVVIGSFFLLVFLFSISGGFAGLSYSDLLAKTIPTSKRTTLFTIKQFFGSSASLLGGVVVARIFSENIEFPLNYSLSLLIGAVGLLVASIGFWFVREPRSPSEDADKVSLLGYIRRIPDVFRQDASFRTYVIVENLSAAGIMILPFYILHARQELSLDNSWIGTFLLLQIGGTIASNLFWGLIGRRFQAKAVVRICILLGALNPLLALALVQVSPVAYGLVFVIMGFTISGRRIGFESTLLELAPPKWRMDYLGIRGTLNLLVVVLPLLGALFIDWMGYGVTFVLVSIIMIVAAVLMSKVTPVHYEDDLCL